MGRPRLLAAMEDADRDFRPLPAVPTMSEVRALLAYVHALEADSDVSLGGDLAGPPHLARTIEGG